MSYRIKFVVAALALSASLPAYAGTISGGPGIAAPNTITFDEVVLPADTPLTNQYSGFGVTFGNAFYSPQVFLAPNIDATTAGNFNCCGELNPLQIFFNSAQITADVAVITNSGTSTFNALLNGVVVDSFTAGTDLSSPNNFYGFTGDLFNEIDIYGGGFNGAMLIDNIQFGATTPLPAALPLFATGLAGLGLLGWRRERKAQAAT